MYGSFYFIFILFYLFRFEIIQQSYRFFYIKMEIFFAKISLSPLSHTSLLPCSSPSFAYRLLTSVHFTRSWWRECAPKPRCCGPSRNMWWRLASPCLLCPYNQCSQRGNFEGMACFHLLMSHTSDGDCSKKISVWICMFLITFCVLLSL